MYQPFERQNALNGLLINICTRETMAKSFTSIDLTHTVEILDQEVLKASLTSTLTYFQKVLCPLNLDLDRVNS